MDPNFGSYVSWPELTKRPAVPELLLDASELTKQVPDIIDNKTFLIAMLRSGESGEIARITRNRQLPGASVSVTNDPGNSFSNWADIALSSHAGTE